MFRVFVPLLFLILAGCSSTSVQKDRSLEHTPRKQVERVVYSGSPSNQAARERTMLVGQVYITDRVNGGNRTGALIDVVLNPISNASQQWYQEVCRSGKVLTGQAGQAYRSQAFATKTNEFGQFAFPSVPTGEYYLTSRLYWIDTKPMSGPVEYGGLLAKKVNLVQGTNAIDLNDSDKCQRYFH
ncbi:MAG: carboxypeptidase regulatory-like domain-containing protein [Alcaligenaceae bacterium]|nr:carboxypeptidase regulatory-like domain-containing protein [Alcaligenaceae bacterium]